MRAAKRKALEEAGFVFGDAEDFLELTQDERAEVAKRLEETRVVVVNAEDRFDELPQERQAKILARADEPYEQIMKESEAAGPGGQSAIAKRILDKAIGGNPMNEFVLRRILNSVQPLDEEKGEANA